MGSADELLASRDVERPQAACSVSCTIVSVERVSVFEYCKDIRPRLSKDRRHVNTTFARVHTLTCHTVHVQLYCAVCASSTQATIAHTAERTAPPSALPSQQHCMRTFCPTRAAAVAPGWHLHCHATSMLRHGLHTVTGRGTRPTAERTTARLAGVARRTRRAAHPSRAPTAASPGRSPRLLRLAAAPSPLPTAPADSACPACARNCGKDRSPGSHHRSG